MQADNRKHLLAAVLALTVLAPAIQAEVARVEIVSRQDVLGGKFFGFRQQC